MNNLKKELPNQIFDLSLLAAKELQELLNKAGYNLVVDGVVGRNTANAFNQFKEKTKLTNPNEIGTLTLDYLTRNNKEFIYPTQGRISSPYGWRAHPIKKTRKFHSGVDFANNFGTPIVASHSGLVNFSGVLGGYGNTIKIQNGDTTTLYAHCGRLLVNMGQQVRQGQKIAEMGSSGLSSGPHLHFEIWKNGKHTNPMNYL